jgi:quinol monooxygenase YgiN
MSYWQESGIEGRSSGQSWTDRPGGASTFLYRTASFVARPDAVTACRETVEEFVEHVNRAEIGTRFMGSFQDAEDPSHFLLVMVFDDERAERTHRSSRAFRRFATDMAAISVAEMRAQRWSPHAGV